MKEALDTKNFLYGNQNFLISFFLWGGGEGGGICYISSLSGQIDKS